MESEPIPGETAEYRLFDFDLLRTQKQQGQAKQLLRQHVHRRERDDLFRLKAGSSLQALYAFDTGTDLDIIDRKGNRHPSSNVFVSINLLELGIEVVRAIKYHLQPQNYILDGEILVREDGETELVRMPCALLSHEALKRSFSPEVYQPRYTDELQPTFVGTEIASEEIRFFTWDVRQRLKRMRSSLTPAREKQRLEGWYKRYGHFFESDGRLREVPHCFHPGTAKILCQYFCRSQGQVR